MSSNLFFKYFGCCSAYEFIRTLYITNNAKINNYNYKKNQYEYRDLLISEKLFLVSFNMSISFWKAPYNIMNDISTMELKTFNKDFYNDKYKNGRQINDLIDLF